MVAEMVLLNPITGSPKKSATARGKKQSKTVAPMAKKGRTAAQKAATKKLIAYNKAKAKHHAGGSKKSHAKPHAKKKHKKSKKHHSVKSNPIMGMFKSKKKNRFVSTGKKMGAKKYALELLSAAGLGIVGGVGLNLLMPHIPLPAKYNTSRNRMYLAGGIGLVSSFAVAKAVGKEKGIAVGAGMLVFVVGNLVEQVLSEKFPTIKLESIHNQAPAVATAAQTALIASPKLSALGYVSPSEIVNGMDDDDDIDDLGEMVNGFDDGMSEFLNGFDDRMGGLHEMVNGMGSFDNMRM